MASTINSTPEKPISGYPRHRENRENGPKNSLSGKTQGIGKFCQNTGNFVKTQGILSKHREFCQNTGNFVKTQGILLAQVVNALILKVKDIAVFAAKKNHFFPRSWIGLPSQFCVCNSHNLWKLAQGKFAVGQGKNRENTRNLKKQFEWVPCNMNSSCSIYAGVSHFICVIVNPC